MLFPTLRDALKSARQLEKQLRKAGYEVEVVVEEPAAPAPPPAAAQDPQDRPVTPLDGTLLEKARAAGALGTPILLGGEDVEDMCATLVAYRDPQGGPERFVMYCKLRPQAEEKLMAALAAAQEMHYEKRVREETVVDRAPFDQEGNVAERLVQYAKSVNHHVGEGTPIPEKTVKGIQELKAYLEKVAQNPTLSDGERALLEAYRKDLAEVEAACAAYQKTPRKDYSKRVGPWTRKVEELVPVPGKPGGLWATTREGTRIAPREERGVAYWDGATRAKGHYGKEIVVDFGDGWQAVYHPHHDDYGVPWSYKGTFELHLPSGADPVGIPEHLERLYVQGQPMTREGAELVYLERNAWALGLTQDPRYRAIQDHYGARLEALASELAFNLPPDEAGEDPLRAVVRARLEAERRVAREKVPALKRLLEKRLGLPEGGLEKLPTYDPMPRWQPVHCPAQGKVADVQTPGGFFVWKRLDTDRAKLREMFAGCVLGHSLTGDRLANLRKIVLGTGVLAAQETRWRMGAKPQGSTMSPAEDQVTGGAAYVFLSLKPQGVGSYYKFDIEWDPEVLLERSDWFCRTQDTYGATNPKHPYYKKGQHTTDLEKAASWAKQGLIHEVCFKNGVSIFAYPPRRIRVPKGYRDEVLGWFKQLGVTHLGDRPVEDVVVEG